MLKPVWKFYRKHMFTICLGLYIPNILPKRNENTRLHNMNSVSGLCVIIVKRWEKFSVHRLVTDKHKMVQLYDEIQEEGNTDLCFVVDGPQEH